MQRILLTGSAGFIGYHVAKKLLEQGNILLGIDNFNNYYPTELKNLRNSLLLTNSKFRFKVLDLVNFTELVEVFEKFKPDLIIHLAAQAGVRYSLTNPHAYIQSNLVGFSNILECCRHLNLKKLIYASSSSVYGANQKIPFSIEDRTDSPISLYAATKKSNELLAYTYNHLFGIQTIGLRFFTVYGEFGRPDMAIWEFTEKISREIPINVYNQGEMFRDFTYIDDIVEGVCASLNYTSTKDELFNLGNNQPEKLLNLINLIEQNIGKKAKINFQPIQPGDVQTTYADITSAQQKLNFQPKTSLINGLPKFITWYQQNSTLAEIIYQWRLGQKKV